jgi:hypothetical protein
MEPLRIWEWATDEIESGCMNHKVAFLHFYLDDIDDFTRKASSRYFRFLSENEITSEMLNDRHSIEVSDYDLVSGETVAHLLKKYPRPLYENLKDKIKEYE